MWVVNEKKLGKISKVEFGLGGYQGCQLGLHLTFDGGGWGVRSSECFWDFESIKWSERCKWTDESRNNDAAAVLRKLSTLLKQAKVETVDKLKGIPIECEFDGMCLKSWRILEEVL